MFNGDKKVGKSILHKPERMMINCLVPKLPKYIKTYHLTLMTLPFSILIVFFSYLSLYNVKWLWGVSIMIALQWLTDTLDGAVGRARNTGLIKWGYYMDHFLDYVFLSAVTTGYLIIIPEQYEYIKFFVFILFVGFMINSYLSFAITNEFRISYLGIGPTEIRLVFIILNSLIIILGRTHLAGLLPYVVFLAFIGLAVVVYSQQKKLWLVDMETKNKRL